MKQTEPYWWDAAPPRTLPHGQRSRRSCDVVVVGAGYTGPVRGADAGAGRAAAVQVFDKMRPGEGASTRNGGIASGNLRPSYSTTWCKTFGEARAKAIQPRPRPRART